MEGRVGSRIRELQARPSCTWWSALSLASEYLEARADERASAYRLPCSSKEEVASRYPQVPSGARGRSRLRPSPRMLAGLSPAKHRRAWSFVGLCRRVLRRWVTVCVSTISWATARCACIRSVALLPMSDVSPNVSADVTLCSQQIFAAGGGRGFW